MANTTTTTTTNALRRLLLQTAHNGDRVELFAAVALTEDFRLYLADKLSIVKPLWFPGSPFRSITFYCGRFALAHRTDLEDFAWFDEGEAVQEIPAGVALTQSPFVYCSPIIHIRRGCFYWEFFNSFDQRCVTAKIGWEEVGLEKIVAG